MKTNNLMPDGFVSSIKKKKSFNRKLGKKENVAAED